MSAMGPERLSLCPKLSVRGSSRSPRRTVSSGGIPMTAPGAKSNMRPSVRRSARGVSPLPECDMPQLDFFSRPARPWNAGRIIGAKPPFKPKHVWAIRQQLRTNGRTRDLALFDCAIDAKLRGCDLVKLRVSDVATGGSLRQRATVIQQKTGRPAPFEITDTTREALAAWLSLRGRRSDDWLFPSRSRPGDH